MTEGAETRFTPRQQKLYSTVSRRVMNGMDNAEISQQEDLNLNLKGILILSN